MCDYSLEMYGSRPAREGELYTTTRFPSGSIGFASAGDPRTAVCMQCDTKVMLTDIPPALQMALRVGAEAETFTSTLMGEAEAPGFSAEFQVHELPEQFQPLPVMEARDNPVGKVSVTVMAPVAGAATFSFVTVTV